MESLIFLLAVGAIGYIVYWSIRNDDVKSISEQHGFLRMRDHEESNENPPRDTGP